MPKKTVLIVDSVPATPHTDTSLELLYRAAEDGRRVVFFPAYLSELGIEWPERSFLGRLAEHHVIRSAAPKIRALAGKVGTVFHAEVLGRARLPECPAATSMEQLNAVRLHGYDFVLAVGVLAALTLAYVVLMRNAFPFLVDQRFADAADMFPVLAVVFWMRAIYPIAFSILRYAGNTAPLTKANVIAAAVNVAANFVLIPVLGVWSAPVALLSGFATLAAVSFAYQVRYFPVPWRAALRPQ